MLATPRDALPSRPSVRAVPVGCGFAAALAAVMIALIQIDGPNAGTRADMPAPGRLLPSVALRGGFMEDVGTRDGDPPVRLAEGLAGTDGVFLTRRTRDGAVSENVGSYGGVTDLPYLRFVLARSEGQAGDALFPEIARRAAETGAAVTRLSSTSALPTRLGELEVAAAELDAGDARRASCHVFRFVQPDLELSLSGWLCDAGSDTTRPARLACLIDGLRLAPGTDYLPLRVAFREAPQAGSSCDRPAATAGPVSGPVPSPSLAGMVAAARLDMPVRRRTRKSRRSAAMELGGGQRLTSTTQIEVFTSAM